MLSLEYIAGFVDGEGCIGISKLKSGQYQCRVAVSNTEDIVLRLIKGSLEMCDVYLRLYRMAVRPGANYSVWTLQTSKQSEVVKMCAMIRPYLVLKQRDADLVLKFLQTRDDDERFVIYQESLRLKSLKRKERSKNC